MGTKTISRIESECDRCGYEVLAEGDIFLTSLPLDWAHVEVGKEHNAGFSSTLIGLPPLFQGVLCPNCKDAVLALLKPLPKEDNRA